MKSRLVILCFFLSLFQYSNAQIWFETFPLTSDQDERSICTGLIERDESSVILYCFDGDNTNRSSFIECDALSGAVNWSLETDVIRSNVDLNSPILVGDTLRMYRSIRNGTVDIYKTEIDLNTRAFIGQPTQRILGYNEINGSMTGLNIFYSGKLDGQPRDWLVVKNCKLEGQEDERGPKLLEFNTDTLQSFVSYPGPGVFGPFSEDTTILANSDVHLYRDFDSINEELLMERYFLSENGSEIDSILFNRYDVDGNLVLSRKSTQDTLEWLNQFESFENGYVKLLRKHVGQGGLELVLFNRDFEILEVWEGSDDIFYAGRVEVLHQYNLIALFHFGINNSNAVQHYSISLFDLELNFLGRKEYEDLFLTETRGALETSNGNFYCYGDKSNYFEGGPIGPTSHGFVLMENISNIWPDFSIGIDDSIQSAETFLVSPNPNTGKFNVAFNYSELPNNVQILNINGEIIFQDKTSSPSISIDLSHVPTGVYFVRTGNLQTKKNISN